MKVDAYLVECCGKIKTKQNVIGVSMQQGMFENIDESYKTIMNPEKADVHYCLECYSNLVIDAANRFVDRKKDEAAYQEKVKELSYSLRKSCVFRHLQSQKNK